MKKPIISLLFILFLSSCNFFNQNIENSKNNSGNIVSENSSQTSADNSQAKENSEEKNLSTEYEVISEKSYFYTNPDDTEARKAYVMKGDKVIVNNEKSTENMIFAIYTNSSGKTTEGYLKKSEIKAIESGSQKEIKPKNSPKCKNSYDFLKIPDGYGEPTGKIRLHFGWEDSDCKQQKKIEMIPEMFDSIKKFYKGKDVSTINTNISIDTGWGYNILDIINLSSKEISVNGEKILLTATKVIEEEENGPKISYHISINISDISFDIESSQNTVYQDLENISDNLQKYFSIEHLPYKKEDHIEKERIKKEREEKIINDKLNKIMAVKWTADMLAEAEFGSEGQYIILNHAEGDDFWINTGLSGDKGAIPLCNNGISKSNSECSIEKIQGGKIYWKSESWHSRNLHNAVENSSWTQYFITDMKAETTKLVKKESSSSCIYDDGRETDEYCE